MSLRLRMLTPENSLLLFLLISKNKKHLEPWFEWANHVDSEQDCLEFIENSNQKDFGIWVDDALIGVIGFHEINWNHKHAEIGYWIAEDQQHKGYVKLAVKALIAYLLLEFKLNRIEILCAINNKASRGLAEKLGFQFEGIQRDGYHFQDRFSDVACYSLLAREFVMTDQDEFVQIARDIRR